LIEANNQLSKKTWFASSTERKYEDAAEAFDKAANAYKVGGMYSEAGDAYRKAADLQKEKLNNLSEASKMLSNAGSCYSKISPADAITSYREAVTLLCDAGRLNQAAKLSKQIGEIHEKEIAEGSNDTVVAAIESYEQAAELFQMEDAKSQASQCLSKVAELSSAALNPPDLLKAAQLYDDLGRQCLESNLLKYNAKGYFVQCILCHLAAGDPVASEQAVSRFNNLDFTFADSREGKFCSQLVECVDKHDSGGFATACFEFDRISKLDAWKTSILVQVKRSIEDDVGVLGADADDADDINLT